MAVALRIAFPTNDQLESANGITVHWLRDHVAHADPVACLEWPYSKMRYGYGHLNVARKFYPAHRLMCLLAHGEPTNPHLVVAHSCHNTGCVNPHHLRWATPKENSADMINAGRSHVGERQSMTFLSDRDVRAIRHLHACGVVQRRLAEAFRISPQRVNEIVKRKAWKHLHG